MIHLVTDFFNRHDNGMCGWFLSKNSHEQVTYLINIKCANNGV